MCINFSFLETAIFLSDDVTQHSPSVFMLNEKNFFLLVLPDAPTQNCQKGAERIDKCKKYLVNHG